MKSRLLLDTDVLVDFLRGQPHARAFINAKSDRISLSAIVVAELYNRDYYRSHGVGLADAVIAATAESLPAELTTLNTEHYPMLKGLKPPCVKKASGI